MTEFVSVLSCIRGVEGDQSHSNGSGEAGGDEEHLDEKEEKEVEDIVEDFMDMTNKDMLRKNLKRMATENVNLRKKVARYSKSIKLLECSCHSQKYPYLLTDNFEKRDSGAAKNEPVINKHSF